MYKRISNYAGYLVENSRPRKQDLPSSADLVIIVHTKDLYKIPYLISNWKSKIIEDISSTILITNDPKAVTSEISKLVNQVISDDSFFEVQQFKKLMHAHPNLAWYTQQILKIAARHYSPKYIIIDADTLLLRPHKFFNDDIPIVRISHESGAIYRKFENMIGLKPDDRSYIPHMGSFSKETVSAYCSFIQRNSDIPWFEVIARFILDNGGHYSEWNSFNKFILQKYQADTRYWLNKSESRSLLKYSPTIIDRALRSSISFHEPH